MDASTDELIYRISKSNLRAPDGTSYSVFKRGLRPRYAIVWRDIGLGYCALALVASAVAGTQSLATPWLIISILVGAVGFGFTLGYLNLFFHEAAHTNLAPSPKWNDFLANWTIGILFGQSIECYRLVHWGHHQHHGTPVDTEHSYFDPLNVRFIFSALFGVRAFSVARQREIFTASAVKAPPGSSRNALLRGVVLNGIVVGGLWFAGYWSVSIAWVFGVLSIFPFVNALRQLLEHRDEGASDEVDYAKQEHGRVNRLFGDSVLAQTFGGAGFNRHLLHHWEPQVSYTRLRELERFVMRCECAPLFQKRQSSYTRLLLHFLKRSRKRGAAAGRELSAT